MKSNISSIYRKKDTDRILQGDIFRDVKIPFYDLEELKIIESGFLIVLSQDCDLNQDYYSRNDVLEINFDESNKKISSFNNKMIPSILLCPAYPADQVRQGTHLNYLEIEMTRIGKPDSTSWKNIIQNETPRYHFLKESNSYGMPDIVIDFKRFYTLSRNYLYSISNPCYICSINELYRENLSSRFSNYISRIGLP